MMTERILVVIVREMITKEHEETFGVMDMLIILIVVMDIQLINYAS